MNIFKPCSFTDCPAHPDYIDTAQEKIETFTTTSSNFFFGGTGGSSSHGAIDSSNLTMNNIWNLPSTFGREMKLSFECFICKHLKKCDMRELLVINKIKKDLTK